MNRKNKKPAISVIKDIKRQTRRKFSSEEKIRIIIEGMRGEDSIAEICRKEGIYPSLYYKWSKDFMEAGKKRLLGDTVREANTSEVKDLRDENNDLKLVVAELFLKNRVLKPRLCNGNLLQVPTAHHSWLFPLLRASSRMLGSDFVCSAHCGENPSLASI